MSAPAPATTGLVGPLPVTTAPPPDPWPQADAWATLAQSLHPHHRAMLVASGISPAVAEQRGYRTVETKADLARLGFSRAQQITPALLIPIWGVTDEGAPVTHQIRPDTPRLAGHRAGGKVIKYETPVGSRLRLDVPRAARHALGDPSVPLWITEGVRKADAAVSHGARAVIALPGVWGFRGTNSAGGKVVLDDWDTVALNGRTVFVAFDSDVMVKPAVAAALRALTDFLRGRSASSRLCYLPAGADGAKVGLDDYLAGGGTLADLATRAAAATENAGGRAPKSAPEPAQASTAASAPAAEPRRPRIVLGPDIQPVVTAAEDALLVRPDLELYQRAGSLVRVVRAPAQGPLIASAPQDHLTELLSIAASWVKIIAGPDGATREVSTLPPGWVAKTFLARSSWRLRHLAGVIEAPTLRRDGSLLESPGYDAASGLLYEPAEGMVFPRIDVAPPVAPPAPSAGAGAASEPTGPAAAPADHHEDARAAASTLQVLLDDFPFVADHDRSAALAALITPLVRSAIPGPCPLFAISATTPGSGKSLLADLAAILATGREARRMTQRKDADEDAKTILALALEGPRLALIDNVEHPLGSDALAAALTGATYSGRVLGFSRTASPALDMVWYATGNNLELRGDLSRRVVPITLDPRCERPETRAGFRFPHLADHVRTHRAALVVAALRVVLAYVRAGRPTPAPDPLEPFGSFTGWSDLVRSALVWVGYPDPCTGCAALRDNADPAIEAWGLFLETWQREIGPIAVTVPDLIARAKRNEQLLQALTATDGRIDPDRLDARRIGYVLRRWKGRICGGRKVERGGHAHGNVVCWVCSTEVDCSLSNKQDTSIANNQTAS